MGTYADLHGKVAIITGAGRPKGLGEAMARRLAAEGCKVVVSDIGAARGAEMPAGAIGSSEGIDGIVEGIRAAGSRSAVRVCRTTSPKPARSWPRAKRPTSRVRR